MRANGTFFIFMRFVFLLLICFFAKKGQTTGVSDSVIPKIEPITSGAPNRPYSVAGKQYEPLNADVPFRQRGQSSWYGHPFHGRRTASGETFDMNEMTAAHPTLPIPSYVRVSLVGTDRTVIVRINDRGPFHASRVMDLSYAAAKQLGIINQGTAEVDIERLTFDDIREGKWQQSQDPVGAWIQMTFEAAQPDVIANAPSQMPAPDVTQMPYWVQLAVFEQAGGADAFRQRIEKQLGELALALSVYKEGTLSRLQLGPFAGPAEAALVARRVRMLLHLTPLVMQRS